jgi:hypothetical protein
MWRYLLKVLGKRWPWMVLLRFRVWMRVKAKEMQSIREWIWERLRERIREWMRVKVKEMQSIREWIWE